MSEDPRGSAMATGEAQIFFQPICAPADKASRQVANEAADELGLPATAKAREKALIVLSSLFWACQRLRRDGGTNDLIGWSHDDKYWEGFEVGKAVIKRARQALVEKGWLTLHAPAEFKASMTVYRIAEHVFERKGSWVQSHRLPLVVRSEKVKIYALDADLGGHRLTRKHAKELLGAPFETILARMTSMNEFWANHPLEIEDQLYASATRVFNDSSLSRGGRFYGGWTNLPEAIRLSGTIEGDPVAEIDIRAGNLTLLCGLTGSPMPEAKFDDPYSYVDADRHMTKMVVLELMGKGNPAKRRGSASFSESFGKGKFVPVRDSLVAAYPALKLLEPGVLDSNAFAFHESEIVMATILNLQTRGVVAYPMHDALICKASQADKVADVLQEAFEASCGIRPALTIQTTAGEKNISGCYTSR